MNIPFLDLKKQYKDIQEEVDTAISRVVKRQVFILGEELEAFEKEFASYLGCKYVVGVGSGTEGLILSLMALGIGKGDEVITPVNSFIATTIAITQVGATPIFVDCYSDTYQINVEQVREKITKKTKAILPVHLYGAPCEIMKLQKIAKESNIFLVEDACQAHGAMYKNKKVGTFGDLGVFSFYPGKNLGAYGDGGAICTDSEELYKRLKRIRNYGQEEKYYSKEIGINSRLDEIQAAILRVKLKYLDEWNKERNEIAQRYKRELIGIRMQKISENTFSCYHLFVIENNKRDELRNFLKVKGIDALIHYPVPIHLQKCYEYLGYKKGDFPVSERVSDTILSIPIYPELKVNEQKYISKELNDFS